MSENHAEQVEIPQENSTPLAEAAALLEAELLGETPENEAETKDPEPEARESEQAEGEPESDDGEQPGAENEQEGESPEAETAIDYEQLIPMPGGDEPMKLGELKDLAMKAKHSEAQLIERENAIMRDQDKLRELIAANGGEVPPEVQTQMREQLQQHLQREHNAMLEAIPEWKDPSTFQTERQELFKLFQSYGFNEDDVAQIADHRPLKMARDLMRLMNKQHAKIEQLEAARKATPKKQRKKSKSAGRREQFQRAQQGGINEKIDYATKLLGG